MKKIRKQRTQRHPSSCGVLQTICSHRLDGWRLHSLGLRVESCSFTFPNAVGFDLACIDCATSISYERPVAPECNLMRRLGWTAVMLHVVVKNQRNQYGFAGTSPMILHMQLLHCLSEIVGSEIRLCQRSTLVYIRSASALLRKRLSLALTNGGPFSVID